MESVHELAKEFFGKFSYRGVMGLTIVSGSFLFLFMLLFKPIPAANASAINVAMGFVLGVLGAVAGYYFGASKDSSDVTKAKNVTSIIQSGQEDVTPIDNPLNRA